MRSITVQIPSPCPERWGDMQPNQQGRFCAQCQKTVVDYTALSDQELVRRLSKTTEASCGRFRDEQLNRPLATSTEQTVQIWRRWIGVLTMSLVGWQTAKAQPGQSDRSVQTASTRPTTIRTDTNAISEPDQYASGLDKKWTISGRVMSLDSSGNLVPVQSADVSIGRLADYVRTQTDSAGHFKLEVSCQPFTSDMTAYVYSQGYIPKTSSFSASPSIGTYVLDDIIVRQLTKRTTISGGGICTIKSPSRWQKLKRKLFR